MNLPLFIASRYLFAKKSHNVINVISAISSVGMAIGTAALVIILSVYNGFDEIISSSAGTLTPDLLVEPSHGKTFGLDEYVVTEIASVDGVEYVWPVLREQVFVSYDGRQAVAVAKGVEESFEENAPVRDALLAGEWELHFGELSKFAVGASLASELEINPRFVTRLELWFPDRNRPVSMSNPAASVNLTDAQVSCVFQTGAQDEGNLVLLPLEQMQELLSADPDEFSAVEIMLSDGADVKRTSEVISQIMGPDFTVKDRYRQNEALYKMMRYEKLAIFLILVFVIIVIAFNIFGSLSLLIIEKKDDISTFNALGLEDRSVRRVFILEGWMISLLGMAAGLLLGLLFAFLQQSFGFIRMPAGFVIDAYPVVVHLSDLLAIALSVALVGYLIAILPVIGKKFCS